MNRTAVLGFALLLLAAAPDASPVIAGSVRDQHGLPIENARVTLYSHRERVGSAGTAADGTFAVAGTSADELAIACDFCRTVRLPVGSDGTVVAIVRRYDALSSESPTDEDFRRLPYGDAPSLLSLTPFIVLTQSSRTLPGTQLDDRRASGHGGLFVIDGVPAYDITENVPLYSTVPLFDSSGASVRRSSDAYLYGDTADAGTFSVQTLQGNSEAAIGSQNSARAAFTSQGSSGAAAYSGASGGERSRAGASGTWTLPQWTAAGALGSGQGNENGAGTSLANAFSSASLALRRSSGADVSADFAFDRGSYDYTSTRFPSSGWWSDANATVSIRSHTTLAPFALVNFRQSNSEAVLVQTRGVAGAQLNDPHFTALAAFGNDAVSYGPYAASPGLHENVQDSVVSAAWSPSSAMSLEASSSRGYTLPTFTAAYGGGRTSFTDIPLNSILESTLSFNDTRSIRASVTALRFTNDRGISSGSFGASFAWQATPFISVRTWVLRNADTAAGDASVGSFWTTYDNGMFRIDTILRRDILDNRPETHLDASLSGPLTQRIIWFVGTEERNGVRGTEAGIRL